MRRRPAHMLTRGREPAPFRHALWDTTALLAGPYGYAVSLGGSAAIAAARLGKPTVLDVLLYGLGAICAFLLAAIASGQSGTGQVPHRVSSVLVYNALPLPALLIAWLATFVPWRLAAFWACGFGATATYVLAVALLLTALGNEG